MAVTVNWRPATASEYEDLARGSGVLPPGVYTVFGGDLPPKLAGSLCGLLAAVDLALPPRPHQHPRADSHPEWAEVLRLTRGLLGGLKDDLTLVVGVGRRWSAELRLSPGCPALGLLDLGACIEFKRRRQGWLESSPGFFGAEDC